MARDRRLACVDSLSLGVIATYRKPDERRLAIHPEHLAEIPEDLRRRMFLERGYGRDFGMDDEQLASLVAGLRTREELSRECDIVVLPKPLAADLADLRPGQVLWGWPHCVQDAAMTQAAIDGRLTLIAWEAMNHWDAKGGFSHHVFHENNAMAGYCSVLHALQLGGVTGAYGRRLRAAVISFGATARGAVTGLSALGVDDVTVFTHREVDAVDSPFPWVRMSHFARDARRPGRAILPGADGEDSRSLTAALADYDVIVNCILQDTDEPLLFVMDDDLGSFRPGTLFVDVSCDEGMGFEWARPTSFADPMFTVGHNLRYYAVDHSPSFLWNSATWVNSRALLEYLPIVMAGPGAWDGDETVRRAIEIREGHIQNPRILSFQQRAAAFPHEVRA